MRVCVLAGWCTEQSAWRNFGTYTGLNFAQLVSSHRQANHPLTLAAAAAAAPPITSGLALGL